MITTLTKMITTLTKEQEKQIPKYIEKYLSLAHKKTNRKEATLAVQNLYESSGFKKPIVVFGKSPFQTALMVVMYKTLSSDKELLKLNSQLYSQLYSQLESQLEKLNNDWWLNVWWLAWAGWYSFGEYVGVKFDEKTYKLFMDFVTNVSFIVPYEGIAFVSETPTQISWQNQRLNNESGPTIKYDSDGQDDLYFLNGVRFEKDLWEKVVSTKMSFQEILKIDNTEQRLVAMRYNPNALMKENPKLINKSERGNELWLIENSEVNKVYDAPKVYLLGFIDPSKQFPNNKFYEECSLEVAEKHPDADFLNASHCKMTIEQYKTLEYET